MSGLRATAINCPNRKRGSRLSTDCCSMKFVVQNITRCILVLSIATFCAAFAGAQGAPNPASLSWDQVKARFETANPTMKADEINVDEMRAQEITAFLRPNPQFTLS